MLYLILKEGQMMLYRGMILALVVASTGHAQQADPEAGRDIFQTSCWQCHGKDAKGVGPMAEMLAISPPDLTALSQRNGGAFPTAAVAMQIDGRAPMLAHGGAMPIFGPSLASDEVVALRTQSGQPMLAARPLADVIAYLNSIQVN
jgi:mono/diheme cytochrome c family protein